MKLGLKSGVWGLVDEDENEYDEYDLLGLG